MGEHLFQVTQGSNFDTATINDPYLIFKKQEQLKKARKTIISSVDDILNSSFIGPLKDIIYDVRDAFATILVSDRANVRTIMENVLRSYVDRSDRDFVKISQKAVSDLFDWAVQTNTSLNDYVGSILLGTDTEQSAAKSISEFKNKVLADKNHPLYNNLVINTLNIELHSDSVGSKKGRPENVYITSRDNKVYDQNQLIYSFRELREYLKTQDSDLYKKLVRLAIIQSGTATSPISFTSLLPYEDFRDEYNETLGMLENIPNLEDFYTLNVFERNNWNNTDVVIFKPYTIRKSKKGRYFNPNMDFVANNLKLAMQNKAIPKVINFSTLSREGSSDFITYTWENKISKADKAKARKKSDRSYINKGLFQKVYTVDKDGKPTPLIQSSTYNGMIYTSFVYKQINAWGDSYRANEFYDYKRASVLDNDFVKVEEKFNENNIKLSSGEVSDDIIANSLYKTTLTPFVEKVEGGVKLKDGNVYSPDQLVTNRLLALGYTLQEAGVIIKNNKC
jgi:hypothetical protein